MIPILNLIFSFSILNVNCVHYHSYLGRVLTSEEIADFTKRGLLDICGKKVEPCDTNEGRRIDGSCNNYKYETSGMANLPYERLLPPEFGPDNSVSTASDGSPLPLARRVRTQLFTDGIIRSHTLNPAALHYGEFMVADVTGINGLVAQLTEKQYCCTERGKSDSSCMPLEVPGDDPYFRGSGVKCLNMTRASTFQDMGCLSNRLQSEPMNFATPILDLSPVYGTDSTAAAKLRSFKDGKMTMVERNGMTFPPNTKNVICSANLPNETSCYGFGQPFANVDARLTLMTLWFLRYHNFLAGELEKINPCWDDQTLYDVARQINIGIMQNIYMYEWTPLFLAKDVLLKNKIIYKKKGRINDYNYSVKPHVLAEFVMGTRMLHTLIDGKLASYCPRGQMKSTTSFSNQMGHPAFIESDMLGITYGTFWQPVAALDTTVDPDISETLLSQFQKFGDLYSMDIMRARDFGMAPYYKYREYCGLPPAKCFDDFVDVMPRAAVDKLKKIYKKFEDVEMMVGLFLERLIGESFVGHTLQCIMIKQSLAWRVGDRFWFENGDQETSLTDNQIKEIRKSTLSRVACDVADGVTAIQKDAFIVPGPENKQVSCSEIVSLDLNKWIDPYCEDDN